MGTSYQPQPDDFWMSPSASREESWVLFIYTTLWRKSVWSSRLHISRRRKELPHTIKPWTWSHSSTCGENTSLLRWATSWKSQWSNGGCLFGLLKKWRRRKNTFAMKNNGPLWPRWWYLPHQSLSKCYKNASPPNQCHSQATPIPPWRMIP